MEEQLGKAICYTQIITNDVKCSFKSVIKMGIVVRLTQCSNEGQFAISNVTQKKCFITEQMQ